MQQKGVKNHNDWLKMNITNPQRAILPVKLALLEPDVLLLDSFISVTSDDPMVSI